MLYFGIMKVKDLIKRLNELGWMEIRVRGSHHQFKHPDGNRTLTVPIHGKEINDVIAKGILKQAKDALKEE